MRERYFRVVPKDYSPEYGEQDLGYTWAYFEEVRTLFMPWGSIRSVGPSPSHHGAWEAQAEWTRAGGSNERSAGCPRVKGRCASHR